MPTIKSSSHHTPSGQTYVELTLSNPDRLNVIQRSLMHDLQAAIAAACNDDDCRAIVLRGEGTKAFIGGADINEMVTLNPDSARQFITTLHHTCLALRQAPIPVIAKIHGYCLGAGLEVAAACDMRIAADNAHLGMPEVRVGIPSVIEAALLPQLIGWGRTRWLLFAGQTITAEQALQWGLVEEVVSGKDLDDACLDLVESIAAAGPNAIRAQKALIQSWENVPLDSAIEHGIETFGQSFETDEPRTMMTQFLTRKKP